VRRIPTTLQRRAKTVQFEKLGQQWRTMSSGEGIKKAIFLVSIVTAIGYYAFLAVLFFIQ